MLSKVLKVQTSLEKQVSANIGIFPLVLTMVEDRANSIDDNSSLNFGWFLRTNNQIIVDKAKSS